VGTAGEVTRDVYFEHNEVKCAVSGFYARTNDGEGTLTEIHERFNSYYALGTSDPTPTSFGSLFFQAGSSTIGRVSSLFNRHEAADGSVYDNGLYTQGAITAAYFEGNQFFGVAVELSLSATIGSARGAQAIATSVTTAGRPTDLASSDRGYTVYDSTLGKVIMWSGGGWLV
jgi:hypothetical protein